MFRAAVGVIIFSGTIYMLPAYAADSNESTEQPSSAQLFKQAVAYEHAEGVPRDYVKAAELYCAAARMGHADAAYHLGWMYANARGMARNDALAVALFKRAADGGHQPAGQILQKISSNQVHLPSCIQTPTLAGYAPVSLQVVDASKNRDAEIIAASFVNKNQKEISTAIARWVWAWSHKDVDAYYAAYDKDIARSSGKSMQRWKAERRAKILDKSWIAVKIEDFDMNVKGGKAEVRFRQDYRSDKLNEVSSKVLMLVKVEKQWLIREERSTAK